MSRRYNERPGHCDRCDPSYEPSILHFTCALKPWFREAEWWRRVAANVSEVRRRWRLYGEHADEGCTTARFARPHRAPRPDTVAAASAFIFLI